LLDVRERDAFEEGHVPGARLLPRGQLELRVNQELTDPTKRILVYCEFGRISTLATATLRQMGFRGAVALDGGLKAWREAGYPLVSGKNRKRRGAAIDPLKSSKRAAVAPKWRRRMQVHRRFLPIERFLSGGLLIAGHLRVPVCKATHGIVFPGPNVQFVKRR